MFLFKHKQVFIESIRFETVSLKHISTVSSLKQQLQPKTQSELKKNIPRNASHKFSKPKQFVKKQQLKTQNLVENKYLVKEDEKIKLINISNETKSPKNESIKRHILQKEKNFLNKASFDLHAKNLDSNAAKCLELMPSLKKSSIDPKHLTILNSNLAHTIADELKRNETNGANLYIDLNPGVGLVSKHLFEMSTNSNNSYLLVEPLNKFVPLLTELKQKHEKKNIHLVRDNPFGEKFLFKSITKHKLNELVNDDTNLIVYGIIPWNSKGYLTRLYSDYASHRGLFQYKSLPTIYLFVPELLLAKLNPDLIKTYASFNSSLTVLAHMFSKCKIVRQETSENFYPYPQVSQPFNYNKYPLNKLDLKKLFLIKLTFNQEDTASSVLNNNKRLFYLFLTQMFTRPSECVKNSMLKYVCKDLEYVCKEIGLNQYLSIRKIQPYQFYMLFNYLVENPRQLINDLSLELLINNRSNMNDQIDRMKSIKLLNKNLNGQLKLPDIETKLNDHHEFKFIKSKAVLDDLDDLDLKNDLDDDEFEFDLKRNRLT